LSGIVHCLSRVCLFGFSYVRQWRRTTKTVSCLPSPRGLGGSNPTRTTVIDPRKSHPHPRHASSAGQRKTQRNPPCQEPVGHYPPGSSSSSLITPAAATARSSSSSSLSQFSSTGGAVGGPQEVEHCRAAHLIRQEIPHSPLPFPLPRRLLDPRHQLGLLILPPRAEVVARLLHTTVVIRVAPPTVVVRSVVGALQVHTREGMPRLELVIPRGRPLLRPCWDWVRLALLPEYVTLVQVSPLAP